MSTTNQSQMKDLVRVDWDNCTFTVHRSVFTDEEIAKKEMKEIFSKCWLYIGHESELPKNGDFRTRTIGGRHLLFNRDAQGQINAFYNSCRHRGAIVCRESEGNSNAFQCFYHAWTFNSQGKLIGVPGRDSYPETFNCNGEMDLIKVERLENYRGFYFVNYDSNAISLEDYLAGAKEYLDLIVDQSETGMQIQQGTHEYSTHSNWKFVVENSADPYHARSSHATYFDYIANRAGTNKSDTEATDGYHEAKRLGNGHYVCEYDIWKWGRAVARPVEWWPDHVKKDIAQVKEQLIKRFGPERAERIANNDFNMVIFPNLVINNIHSIVIRVAEPVRPNYHNITAWCLLPKDVPKFVKEQAFDAFLEFLGPAGLATPDDNEALELAQLGCGNMAADSWNNLSRGMNREKRNEKKIPMDDEYQLRHWWMTWNDKIMGK